MLPAVREPEQNDATPRAVAPEPRALYEQNVAYVWRSLRYLGVRERDLRDVTQEVFVVAFRGLATFDGRAPRAWLYAICLRLALNHRRLARHRVEVLSDVPPEQGGGNDPERETEQRRDRQRLLGALDRLDPPLRAVFVLYEIESLSMPEVARVLECPLQTAYSRLAAAKRDLRAMLQERAVRKGGAQ